MSRIEHEVELRLRVIVTPADGDDMDEVHARNTAARAVMGAMCPSPDGIVLPVYCDDASVSLIGILTGGGDRG